MTREGMQKKKNEGVQEGWRSERVKVVLLLWWCVNRP